MIVIPNYGPSSSTDPLPRVSAAAAAAPWNALQSVAQGIDQVAKVTGNIASEIQEAENATTVSENLRTLAESEAAFQQSLLEDHDYKNYGARFESEVLTPARNLITPDMPPSVRQDLQRRIDDWGSQASIRVAETAQRKSVQRAGQELAIAKSGFIERGDLDGYLGHLGSQGWMTPEERKLEANEARTLHANRQAEMDIQMDPAGWIAENAETPENAAEFIQWSERRDLARTELRRVTGEAMDNAADLMAEGKLAHPDQVDGMFGDLRPAAREKLKDVVRGRQTAKADAMAATPGYQASIVGKVSAMLADFNPEAEGFDTDYVEMAGLVATLPDSPARDELQRNLRNARDGGLRQLETAADFHRLALDDLHKQGAFGSADPVKTDIRPFIDAGLLTDVKKLRSFGFSTEQAEDITELEGTKQTAEFRRLWHQRAEAGQALADTQIFKVAEAHAMRQTHLESTDLAAVEKSRRAYGAAKAKLEAWIRANPKATESEGRQKLLDITGELAIPGMVESILDAPPSFFDGPGVLPPKPTE